MWRLFMEHLQRALNHRAIRLLGPLLGLICSAVFISRLDLPEFGAAFHDLAWFWLIRHYAATRLSVFTLSTPLFGLGAGALLLGEGISARLVAALAALAAGIVLVNR